MTSEEITYLYAAVSRSIINELGNKITLKVCKYDADSVLIEITGPSSQSQNILTPSEARALTSALDAFFSNPTEQP